MAYAHAASSVRPWVSVILAASALAHSASAWSSTAPAAASAGPRAAQVRLPRTFEENRGQVEGAVRFLSRAPGHTLYLTGTEAVLSPTGGRGGAVRMRWPGARTDAPVRGVERAPGTVHYLTGKDRSKWHTGVPLYRQVRYEDLYPGIDLVYYGVPAADAGGLQPSLLEYDFVVAPGADPSQVRLAFQGAEQARIDPNGDLVLAIAGGELRHRRPVLYQEVDGERRPVAGAFALLPAGGGRKDETVVRFEVGRYDRGRALVIDPVLVFSTYLGGSQDESRVRVALDPSGSAYLAGLSSSPDFPGGAAPRGVLDVFVAKLDSQGALVYATYLGGSGVEADPGIAADAAGSAYVVTHTDSDDFPTSAGAFQPARRGLRDTAVAKLTPDGSGILYGTYLGGTGDDFGTAIAVHPDGSAYVTGYTYSADDPFTAADEGFPLRNPLQAENHSRPDGLDAFVTRLNSTGSGLRFSTYLGGTGDDYATGITLGDGTAIVAGHTRSNDFPTANAAQVDNGNLLDAFVTRFNADGSGLVYSTYLGGSGEDFCLGVAADPSGAASITGHTDSTDFPRINAIQTENHGGDSGTDAVVARFDPAGGLVFSTYLGGSQDDFGFGVAVDAAGATYVAGSTDSEDFPVRAPFNVGSTLGEVFVAKLPAAGTPLAYASLFGGQGEDIGTGIAADGAGNVWVSGESQSSDLPLQAAAQGSNAGGATARDAFLFRISEAAETGGRFWLQARRLNFKNVRVGRSKSLTVLIRNRSPEVLNLRLDPADAPFTVVSGGGSVQIPPRGRHRVTISMAPEARGRVVGALPIRTTDPAAPTTRIKLVGVGR